MSNTDTDTATAKRVFWSRGALRFDMRPCEVPGCVRFSMLQEDSDAKITVAVRVGQLLEDIRKALAGDSAPASGDRWAGDDAEESSYLYDLNRDILVEVLTDFDERDSVIVMFTQTQADGTPLRLGTNVIADSLVDCVFHNANTELWEM